MAKQIPLAVLNAKVNHLMKIILIVMLCVVALSTIVMVFISHSFTIPIVRLTRHIQRIRPGQMEMNIKTNRQDEIGVLYLQFQELMDTINNLILKEYQLGLANKSNQLKALQAQLDPHFINNALQSIGTQALKEGSEELYDLITSLAHLMNNTMNFTQPFIPLIKEVEHVEHYLKLQHQRYGAALQTRVETAPEALDIFVPKMSLQPLVENYFKHGLVQREEGYRLSVTIKLAEGKLIVLVKDNGSGMPADARERMRDRLQTIRTIETELPFGGDDGIGLYNVALRLFLYYGEAAQMEIGDEEYGFSVSLIIPTVE